MYEQVRRALAWVYRNAESFGGDRDRIYISAHSSGSHLAGVVLTRGWQEEGLPPDAFKGAVLLSGMYDLAPVRLSKRSAYVKFTDDMVHKLSGQRYLDGLHTPLVLAYRHLRDAGIPAPVARLRRCGEGGRQAGRADRRRRLQSFRIARDARQPLWSDRARHARADATSRNKENDNEPSRQGARAGQGPARLARHGPEGARRRLRPAGLCAEPRPGAQAQHVQQRPRARTARCAEAAGLWQQADRAARSVRDQRSRTRRSTCSSTAAPGGRAR